MTTVGFSVVGLGVGLEVGLNVTGAKVDSTGEGDGGSVTWNEIFWFFVSYNINYLLKPFRGREQRVGRL